MNLSLKRIVASAVILSGAMWAAGFARADDFDDDDAWKGPGFYEVFYSTGVYLIYSGPYATQDACLAYVKGLGDSFVNEMSAKYGTYGDEDNGWVIYCMPLNTKAECHDLDQ